MSLFRILNIAGQSLTAYQNAMRTVGHNVANAATEGFRRQRVELSAGPPQRLAFGALGTGVRIDTIRRVEDRFLELSLRREIPLLSRFEARSLALDQAELAFSEPSDAGITTVLERFFDAWDDLASTPEDRGARETVLAEAGSLADAVRAARERLEAERRALAGEVLANVDSANRILGELAVVNRGILATGGGGEPPPDLADRRDLLVEHLSEIAGVEARIEDDGTTSVFLGARVLLQYDSVDEIRYDPQRPEAATLGGRPLASSEFEGRLGGLVDALEHDLPATLRRLDEFAVRLAEDVNRIHSGGRDLLGRAAGDVFRIEGAGADGVTGAAAGLRLVRGLGADGVAAGAGGPGDGSIALDLAGLRAEPDGPGDRLRALVVDVGARARDLRDRTAGQAIVVDSYREQRDAVSGVSLDEEATMLLQFQRSYQAAARVVTAVDEMTQSLLAM